MVLELKDLSFRVSGIAVPGTLLLRTESDQSHLSAATVPRLTLRASEASAILDYQDRGGYDQRFVDCGPSRVMGLEGQAMV
ncbi:MAG: hypothetical protein AMXMBFR67_31180 [Nitrospira sp.]